MATPGKLSYEVFISDPIPFSDTDKAPNGDCRMFQPISSTLIFGVTDAVLVDPPMTIEQTERVAKWIENSGKRLVHIYITHGHGDHWFGTAPLLRRFTGASAYAAAGTIEVMHKHADREFRAVLWDNGRTIPWPHPFELFFAGADDDLETARSSGTDAAADGRIDHGDALGQFGGDRQDGATFAERAWCLSSISCY